MQKLHSIAAILNAVMPLALEMFLAGVACGVELLALVKKSK